MTMFDLGGDHIVEVGGHVTESYDIVCTVPIEHSMLTPSAYAESVRSMLEGASQRMGSLAVESALSDSNN